MTPEMSSAEARVLAGELGSVKEAVTELKVDVRDMSDSLRALIRIETNQISTNSTLVALVQDIKGEIAKREALEDRMAKVESKIPPLEEARRWITIGLIAVAGLVGTTMFQDWASSRLEAKSKVEVQK